MGKDARFEEVSAVVVFVKSGGIKGGIIGDSHQIWEFWVVYFGTRGQRLVDE